MLAALACAVAGAPAAVAAPLLPDIVADPPVGGNAPEVQADAQGSRLLLRLDGFVHNRGPGPLEIRGENPSGGVMGTVRQRVYDDAGGFEDIAHTPAPSLIYETNDDHEHWHLLHAMRYSLWSEDKTVAVAPVQKVGFCLIDSQRVEAPASSKQVYSEDSDNFCRWQEPDAASVFMGVSPGWRDIYGSNLAFQWVDISDVAPGRYWLRSDADPDGVIAETDEVNPGAYDTQPSIVNGYRADPVAAGTVPAFGPTPITLSATKFDDVPAGSPGPRQFEIVTPPAGGTLDQPTGTWFSGAQVRYTPKPGFSGPDSFTVAARDASTPFPRTPPSAAVTLTVQGPAAGPAEPERHRQQHRRARHLRRPAIGLHLEHDAAARDRSGSRPGRRLERRRHRRGKQRGGHDLRRRRLPRARFGSPRRERHDRRPQRDRRYRQGDDPGPGRAAPPRRADGQGAAGAQARAVTDPARAPQPLAHRSRVVRGDRAGALHDAKRRQALRVLLDGRPQARRGDVHGAHPEQRSRAFSSSASSRGRSG